MLEALECVLDHSLVERPEICARVPERVSSQEMPEIPVYELPVEAVVVADEEHATGGVLLEPVVELLHDPRGLRECQCLLAREAADGKRLWDPVLRDRLETSVEASIERLLDHHGGEADHAVVTG